MSVPIAIVGAATAPPSRSPSHTPPHAPPSSRAAADRLVDPQQQLFLACARKALEDAGDGPGREPTGVFAGSLPSRHLADRLLRDPQVRAQGITPMLLLGNTAGFTATHTARRLGLSGPSVTMAVGQESSLTAVHRAGAALASGRCRTAVAGGVADADRCAVVVLQRLDEALADRRRILGVIRATARGPAAEPSARTGPRPSDPATGAEQLISAALRLRLARGQSAVGPGSTPTTPTTFTTFTTLTVAEQEPGGTGVHCILGPPPAAAGRAVRAGTAGAEPAGVEAARAHPRGAPPAPRRTHHGRPPAGALIRLRRGTDGRDLFLVHPAGGNVFGYHDLLAHSRHPGSVWALRFPFERLRELSGVPAMARAYLDEIRAVRPDGPPLLGGYSFGGTVAFEIAHQLQQQGEPVERLVLVDALPAAAVPALGLQDFLDALPEFAESVLRLRIPRPPTAPATLDQALELLRQPGWNGSALAEHRRFLQVFWSNSQALAEYHPLGQPLRSPVTLLNVDASTPPAFFARLGVRPDPADWWRDRLAAPPRVLRIPGEHYSIFHDRQHRRSLAAALDQALDPASDQHPADQHLEETP